MSYGTRPRVLGDDEATYDYLDNLVDTNPSRLRDEAWHLVGLLARVGFRPCPSCCTEVWERYGPVDCGTCNGAGKLPEREVTR